MPKSYPTDQNKLDAIATYCNPHRFTELEQQCSKDEKNCSIESKTSQLELDLSSSRNSAIIHTNQPKIHEMPSGNPYASLDFEEDELAAQSISTIRRNRNQMPIRNIRLSELRNRTRYYRESLRTGAERAELNRWLRDDLLPRINASERTIRIASQRIMEPAVPWSNDGEAYENRLEISVALPFIENLFLNDIEDDE